MYMSNLLYLFVFFRNIMLHLYLVTILILQVGLDIVNEICFCRHTYKCLFNTFRHHTTSQVGCSLLRVSAILLNYQVSNRLLLQLLYLLHQFSLLFLIPFIHLQLQLISLFHIFLSLRIKLAIGQLQFCTFIFQLANFVQTKSLRTLHHFNLQF